MPLSNSISSRLTYSLLALASLAGTTFAQTTPATQPTSAPTPPTTPAAEAKGPRLALASEPMKLEAIGLTLYPPEGARTAVFPAGSNKAAQYQAEDQSWLIEIKTPTTADGFTAIKAVADSALTQLQSTTKISEQSADGKFLSASQLIGREPAEGKQLLIGAGGRQVAVERFYLRMPSVEGKDDTVRGFTIAQISPRQFVTWELFTTNNDFAKAKQAYETSIATSAFADYENLKLERRTAVLLSKKVLEGFDTAALTAVLNETPEVWQRLYKPASSGSDADAREVGYRRIRTKIGPRSIIASDDPNNAKTVKDREDGFVVTMDARWLNDGRIVDSRSAYFLSLDKREEVWSVQMAIREGGKVSTFSETGARDGRSTSVRIDGTGLQPKTIKPVFPDDGYLSRVESMVWHKLLLKDKARTTYGSYTYQSNGETIQYRADSLDQPSDKPGMVEIKTFLDPNRAPQVSYYKENGDFVRTEMPDGTIWESTKLDTLVKLWKEKGLPLN